MCRSALPTGEQEWVWEREAREPSFAAFLLYLAGCFIYFISHAIHKGPEKEIYLFLSQK